jgi:hypothetical protein
MGQLLREIGYADAHATPFDRIIIPFEHVLPHQRLGFHYTLNFTRSGVFFEPRCGKSLVLFLATIYEAHCGGGTITIQPPNLFRQYLRDFQAVRNHGVTSHVLNEGPTLRQHLLKKWTGGTHKPNHVVLSREVFKKTWEDLYRIGFRQLIFDECHLGLQSFSSGTAKAVRAFIEQDENTRLILSTGSPIPTHIENAYTTVSLVNPGAYRSQRAFEAAHCLYKPIMVPSKWGMRQKKVIARYQNLDLLHRNLYAKAVAATKRETLRLDAPNLQVVPVELSVAHRKLYSTVLHNRMLEIERENAENGLTETELLDARHASKLRHVAMQILSTPEDFGRCAHNTVLETVETLLDSVDTSRNRVVVFCHYRRTVEALAKRFANRGAVKVYGGQTSEENAAAIDQFHQDPDCRVSILNFASGGVGFKLGDVATTAVFAEVPVSPGQFDQALSRLMLIGQTEPVVCYLLQVENTIATPAIETLLGRAKDIDTVHAAKKSLFEKLLMGEVPSEFVVHKSDPDQKAN